MKSKENVIKVNKNVQKLSLSVGEFIRYWGFRRIHGAVWTQVYLSKKPLSCAELTRRLGLSKALISPALEELCSYKLIREAPAPNDKVKVYIAESDINTVIRNVLKSREAKMLKQITNDFNVFKEKESVSDEYDARRVQSLGEMIYAADFMLGVMLEQKDLMQMTSYFEP